MNKKVKSIALAICGLSLCAANAQAHFGTLTPSDDIISQSDQKTITIDAKFLHPVGLHYMNLAKPDEFGVVHNGKKEDLKSTLQEKKGHGLNQSESFTYWQTDYKIKRPGDYTFFMKPEPYWEPAEDTFIIHYTKVCINALGLEQGWDEPVGLETEIIPLTRPYGLWTGNLFTGKILLDGKPVPNAEVEVEYLNETPGNTTMITPTSDPYFTQVVKADENGVFSYAMPKAGWWGFAALNEASRTIKHDGQDKPIELGAVYWVKTKDM